MKIILITFFLLAITAGIGVAAFLYMQQNSPQSRFYAVLDNSLNTPYVIRKISSATEQSKGLFQVEVSTDFSDQNQLKSEIDYTVRQSDASAAGREVSGKIITVDESGFFGRLNSASRNFLPKEVGLNKWYKVSNAASVQSLSTANAIDYFKLRGAFHSVFGPIPIGSMDEEKRPEIMSFIKNSETYVVTKYVAEEQEDGREIGRYSVEVDGKKRVALNAKLAQVYGNEAPRAIVNSDNKLLEVWVDNKTQRVIRLEGSTKLDSGTTASTVNEEYTYPDKLMIKAPQDAMSIQ